MDTHSELNARIARIVRTYQNSILRLAYAYVRNTQDAEDIAQEIFLAFMKAAPAFCPRPERPNPATVNIDLMLSFSSSRK